jgi:nucleoside-diphosphate-sugar epimerase
MAWGLGALCESVNAMFQLRGEPSMSRFLASQLATSHYFNITRARRDFGYEPKISIAEGMRRLAAVLQPPGRSFVVPPLGGNSATKTC